MQARAAATAAVERAAEPANTQAAPDLEDPSLYFNRELSWLDFNDRVLQLAEDTSVPLLERVKFCAIWESNLDEFFMVRVANLHDQLEAGVDARGADGMSASDQIDAIHKLVLGQRERLTRCLERELRPALAEHGIRIISPERATRKSARELDRVFEKQHLPGADPAGDRPRPPVPLHLQPLAQPRRRRSATPSRTPRSLARVKVPKELLRRFVQIGDRRRRWSRSRTLIAANLELAVPGHGGPRPLPLPGHPRHRLRRLRRGRRPAAGGRGGASPAALRRGRAARGRRGR